jgi:hypothetical protein
LSDGREIDFVIPGSRDSVDTIECKWSVDRFDPAGLKLFRNLYPGGNNYLICPMSEHGYSKKIAGINVFVCNPAGWLKKFEKP